jgi:hypothetical protein
MDRMRWILALALVLLVLVGLTVRIGTRRTKRAPATEPREADVEPVAPPRHVPPARSPLGPAPRERTGVAHLKGRVLVPEGEEDAGELSGLEVVADDGARSFDARLSGGGRFAFHLPPGRYTLTASAGDLVGAALDVPARAGTEREVDIRLGPGAKISGVVRAPAGLEVGVKATIAGETSEVGVADMGDGTFQVTGLVPGRRYDLAFSGPKLRTATLRGLVAPAEGQEIVVDPLAVVRGAIGFPRGERCPIDEVKLDLAPARKGDDDITVHPAADCRFHLAVPENVSQATVVASGTGWFLEERVEIPARGDPDPLCLNPPCREDPTEGLARLRVSLEGGTDDSGVTAEVTVTEERGGHGSESSSCSSTEGWCLLEGLPAGQPLKIEGYGDGCRAETRTMTLPAGETSLRLLCRRQRHIEGVVRIADGAPPESVVVRCAGGGMHTLRHTRLFELTCGADDADLQYQTERGGPWQSVALPAEDPAFVEIGL